MDRCYGIIAEFNPFHNGHAALCARARQDGATHIAAVMSGSFVQRGSPAVTDKYVRTRAALLSGCDLVVELPLPYAMATASQFAAGAVALLRAMGCVDSLCFGTESAALPDLQTAAEAVEHPDLRTALQPYLSAGMTFAGARQLAVAELCGAQIAACLTQPNHILAVEYLRQLHKQGWSPDLLAIPRVGAAHDSADPDIAAGIASASYLRRHPQELGAYVPAQALAVYSEAAEKGLFPACPEKLENAILAHLRRLTPEQLRLLPDVSEGISDRLYKAIAHSTTLPQLEAAVKTKRYPLARVRRLIYSAFLGITARDWQQPPPYIHVLGFNARGAQLLTRMKNAALPVHTGLAYLEKQNAACRRLAALEATATDMYSLTLPCPPPRGYAYSASAVFLKD